MVTYDKQSRFYNELHAAEQQIKFALVLRKLTPHLKKTNKYLDCGCGTGLLLQKLQNFTSIVGVDISLEMLKETSMNLKSEDHNLIRGDSNNLPLMDSIFNLIFAFTLVDGEINGVNTLRELRRVATPDGILIVSMLRICPAVSQLNEILIASDLKVVEVIDVKGLNEIILILCRMT